MTIDTSDVAVFGGPPGLNIRFHNVAGIAQKRARAEAIEPAQREASNDHAGSYGNQEDAQASASSGRLFSHLSLARAQRPAAW
jgi:hypothetical protein